MSVLIEDYIPVVKYQGLNTNKNVVIAGNLTVTGTTTIAAQTLTNLTTTGNTVLGDTTSDTCAISGPVTIGTDLTFAKEVAHTLTVATSTTTNTAGAAFTVSAATGAGTGAGGQLGLSGGQGGASGNAGGAILYGGDGGATAGNGGNVNLTGGNATANNDDGGNVILTPGTQHGSGVPGAIYFRGATAVYQAAPTAKTTSATLTVAELSPGIITVNQGAGGTSALQLPTASALDAAFVNFTTNDAFDFSVINISTVAAEDASLTTNTGLTLVGNMDIASNAAATDKSAGRFRARKTGTGAWTFYRLS